jgi:positive regulator of sigma E activity
LSSRAAVRVGERVVVALPDRYLLLASLLVHGLPLAGLLAGALCGVAALGSDLGAAAGAAGGALLTVLAAPAVRSRVERGTVQRLRLRPAVDRAQARSL